MNQIHDSYVEQGAGKTNATLRWIAENHEKFPGAAGPKRTGIVYVTTREEVENLDFARFLANFGPGHLHWTTPNPCLHRSLASWYHACSAGLRRRNHHQTLEHSIGNQ